jgi:hypothetical protein
MSAVGAVSAFLLLALAGGFLLAYLWERTRYLSLRSEGQQLYLLAAVFAIPLVVVARLIVWRASHLPKRLVEPVESAWAAATGPLYSPALSSFLLAFLLGLVLPLLLNARADRDKLSGDIIERYGSQLEKFFYETMTHKLPASVSLHNRKVYVGWAWRVPPLDPRRVDDYAVRLLPIRSGYRHEKTMELHFTTQYSEVYRRIRSRQITHAQLEDFLVVLPVKHIVSVNLYALGVNPELLKMSSGSAPRSANHP